MTDAAPNPQAPDRDVFISYASQDAGVANAVVETLERNGIRCWIAPRDVKAGAQYADAIIRALTSARVMVLVLSAHSIASSHVSKEIERASSKKRPIIALRTDAAPLTPALEYFLSESQWIEIQQGRAEAAYAKLMEAIRDPDRPTQRGTTSTAVPAARPRARRTLIVFAAGLSLAAIAYVALFGSRLGLGSHSPSPPPATPATPATPAAAIPDKSIAVLPFVDMSEKHDQEYFSDGLSEELIDHLAHNSDLKVIARTSSFAFKGKNEDMRSIAVKLGAANLLEGSVRKSGPTLRITAQLIRASDGVHLWSQIYDRKLTDIFKVQDEISTTVAKALNVALADEASIPLQAESKGTTNIDAYNLVLKASYFFHRSGTGDFDRAAQLLQQALRLDPRYGDAWADLANTYAWQGYAGELDASEAERKGLDAIQHALAIDSKSARALIARAQVFRFVSGNWQAALADYESAANLTRDRFTHEWAESGATLIRGLLSGNLSEFISETIKDLEHDPLDTGDMFDLAWTQQLEGRLEESAATSRRLLDLDPTFAMAQSKYALTLLLLGRNAEALVVAQKESDEPSKLQVLSCIYWVMGRHIESDATLTALERKFADRNPYLIAGAHAYRGEAGDAFNWLDRAAVHKGVVQTVKLDPLFRTLRSDQRFNAYLRRIGLS